MGVSGVSGDSQNNISDAGVSQSVQLDVLKKAINTDQSNALALIQAVPQPPTTPNLPPNLGNNVNTTA